MRMVDLIIKKRDKHELTKEEIEFIVREYTNKNIPDYQMSSFLMAVVLNGMSVAERSTLTMAMVNSGDVVNLSGIEGVKVDKHSTGGVGDKTTLILAPLVASLDIPVAKMSGRGLGHTGGTIDKIEAIEGAQVEIELDDFIKQVNDKKIAVVGQTGHLAPADKLLYALRDVTGTVESIPLIASSIMSKKIAAGSDAIVLDVKLGTGAFMKTLDQARELAEAMVSIGNSVGRETIACITNMAEPLGLAVGNALEVIEAIETLKGNGPDDVVELVLELGANMVLCAKKAKTIDEAKVMLKANIDNGKGLDKLRDFIEAQGGNKKVVDDYSLFDQAKFKIEILADKEGYVESIDALQIGVSAMHLGAGRATKEDVIDMGVGILLNKKQADFVKVGDVLAVAHANREDVAGILENIKSAYNIVPNKVEKMQLIFDVIR